MKRRRAGRGTLTFDKSRGRYVGLTPPEKDYGSGGTRRRKLVSREGESESAFEKRFDAYVAEHSESEAGAPETVGELVDRWFKRLDPNARGQSQGNIDRIESQVRVHVRPVLGDVAMKALTVDDVERWLAQRTTQKGELLARSSLKKLRSIIAQAYDYAIKRQYTTWNPARVADLPREAETKRVGRALTSDEIDRLLLTAKDDRLGAWIVASVTLGLRPGEVSGLEWRDIDFDAGTLVVHQAMATEKGQPVLKSTKTGKTRTLEMPKVTADALLAHRANQTEERAITGDWPAKWRQLVFVTAYGTPMDRSNTRRYVQRIVRDAGIEGNVTSYDLRHTASEYLASQTSMERLADLMGHRDIQTVQRHYRHPETNVIDVAADAWGTTEGTSDTRKESSG